MKKYLLLAVVLFITATVTHAQGYLGIGTGANRNVWIVNMQGGYQAKHFAFELEVKVPPVSQQVSNPMVAAAKAGCPINLQDGWQLMPYLQYGYHYYSADIAKTATWQNGFKAGAGIRLQYKNVFVQADHFKENYFCFGIIKNFGR